LRRDDWQAINGFADRFAIFENLTDYIESRRLYILNNYDLNAIVAIGNALMLGLASSHRSREVRRRVLVSDIINEFKHPN